MEKLKAVKEALKDKGLRITQARLAVAEVLLRNTSDFLSSEEIFFKIQRSKKLECDQVSVYRALTKFEQIGIVIRSSFKGEAARFQIRENTPSHGHHEHYFKCQECEEIEPLEDCLVAKKEKELERKGYKNLSHHLEIVGLCPSCAV